MFERARVVVRCCCRPGRRPGPPVVATPPARVPGRVVDVRERGCRAAASVDELDLVRREEEAVSGLTACTEVLAGVVVDGHRDMRSLVEVVFNCDDRGEAPC